MLVGTDIPLELESQIFSFLCQIESDTVISKSDAIGCYTEGEFSIKLIDPSCTPVFHDVRKCSRAKQLFIDDQLEKLLKQGIIAPTLGSWGAGVVVAPKPGPGEDWRMCVDFKDLNDRTVKEKFPMPNAEEIIENLGGASVFLKLDLAKGYWQIPVSASSQELLSMVTRKGTYKYRRMPFGPMNAPGYFQQCMNLALDQHLYKTCFVYLDDIVVYASSIPELIERGLEVIQSLHAVGLKLSGLKSEFFLTEIELLGRIVKNGQVHPKFDKLQGLLTLKAPTTVTEVRSIYGLLSYYRMFVKDFSKRAKPITALITKAATSVDWGVEQQKALVDIVSSIGQSSLLLPKFGEEFILQTDFSYQGVGAVLSQIVEGREIPVMFASRCLVPAECNYSPTEGEALAVLFGLKRFEYLLQGQKVKIRTDHRPLEFIKSGSENNKKLARWWSELQHFDYTVEYVAGRSNQVPDCLSRLTEFKEVPTQEQTLGMQIFTQQADPLRCVECGGLGEENLLICDCCERLVHLHCLGDGSWPPDLLFWYCRHCAGILNQTDPAMNRKLQQLLQSEQPVQYLRELESGEQLHLERLVDKYLVVNDVLYLQRGFNMLEVVSPRLRLDRLRSIHSDSGHVGIIKLYNSCRRYFYWPYLLEDCAKTIKQCEQCQLSKAQAKFSKLTPVSKFSQPFQAWALDYLPKLPTARGGFQHCLIMVDSFSKWIELIPCKSKSSTEVAQAVHLHLIARFGIPRELRCDRGREFMGELSELCSKYGIRKIHISVMHPQANGQAERYVGVTKAAISKLLKQYGLQRGDWIQCLPSCLVGMRFFQHKVLGITPFTMITGHSPNWPVCGVQLQNIDVADLNADEVYQYLDKVIAQVGYMHNEMALRLAIADLAATVYYNNKHKLIEQFEAGQLVIVKNRTSRVFDLPYIGPLRFVRYKNQQQTAAIVEDGEGHMFDCSVSHILPLLTGLRSTSVDKVLASKILMCTGTPT